MELPTIYLAANTKFPVNFAEGSNSVSPLCAMRYMIDGVDFFSPAVGRLKVNILIIYWVAP